MLTTKSSPLVRLHWATAAECSTQAAGPSFTSSRRRRLHSSSSLASPKNGQDEFSPQPPLSAPSPSPEVGHSGKSSQSIPLARSGHAATPTRRHTTSLPAWIPPKWQAHLQPEAHWRKELLDRRRRLLEKAGEQLTVLGLKLNEVTGYKEVERLKDLVGEKEARLKWLREDAKTAKDEYERAVTTRATTQSDVNSLLERKHAWSDEDVSRFTNLVRSDHSSNQAVMTTAIALKETELAADKAFSDLMQAILQRYHEEQVWSDKIRNVSTYAGLTGLLVNLVVFVGAIAFVEPWKRKRLVERLEERIAGMMEQVEGSIDGLGQKVEKDLAVIRNQSGASALVDTTETGSADLDHEVTFDDLSTPIPMSMPSPWPILTRSLQRVSPLLDRVAEPSHDRDIAFSAGIGALLGVTITALSMWMGR